MQAFTEWSYLERRRRPPGKPASTPLFTQWRSFAIVRWLWMWYYAELEAHLVLWRKVSLGINHLKYVLRKLHPDYIILRHSYLIYDNIIIFLVPQACTSISQRGFTPLCTTEGLQIFNDVVLYVYLNFVMIWNSLISHVRCLYFSIR